MSPGGPSGMSASSTSNASATCGSEIPDSASADPPACSGVIGQHEASEPSLSVCSECGPASLPDWMQARLARIADLLDLTGGRITVAVVDEPTMARLHLARLNRRGPTDVLTFDLRDPAGSGPPDADIVVCFEVASDQARRRGHTVQLELLLYAVHGLLHLTGLTDDDPIEAGRMHRREDELITAIGLSPVYES